MHYINSSHFFSRVVVLCLLWRDTEGRPVHCTCMTHPSLSRSPRALAAPLTTLAAVLALSATPAFAQDAPAPSGAQTNTSSPTPIVIAPPMTPSTAPPTSPTASTPPSPAMNGTTVPTTTSSPVVQPVPPADTIDTAATGTAPSPTAGDSANGASAPHHAARSGARGAAPAAVPVAHSRAANPNDTTRPAQGTSDDGPLAAGAAPLATAGLNTHVPHTAPTAQQAAAPVTAAPASRPQATSNGYALPLAGMLGLLAAFGVAAAGIAGMRRHRRTIAEEQAQDTPRDLEPVATTATRAAEVDQPVFAPETGPMSVAHAGPAPVLGTAGTIENERSTGALTLEPPVLSPAPQTATTAAAVPPVPAAGLTAADVLASSPLPAGAQERQDLLARMVEAEPGEDNPFHARKSRLRRARIQLQHHEHLAEEAAARGERFDFRSYQPSMSQLAAAQPATAQAETAAERARDLTEA